MDKKSEKRDAALFGLLYRRYDRKSDTWRFSPNWKRVSAVFVAAVALVWFGAATAVYSAFKYVRKYDGISYWRVAQFPFDTSKFRTEMGEFQIEEAKQFFKKGELAEGFMSLQNGVARSPDNLEGREMLAQFTYVFLRDPNKASKCLDLKISKAFESGRKSYLKSAILFYAFADDYAEKSVSLVSACERDNLLDTKELSEVFKNIFAMMGRKKDYDSIAKYGANLLKVLKTRELKQIAAGNGAVAETMCGHPESALKMLDAAETYSGEVRTMVEASYKWSRGDEIGALKTVKRGLTGKGKKKSIYKILSKFQLDFGDDKRAEESRAISMLSSQDLSEPLLYEISKSEGKKALDLAKKFTARFPDETMKLCTVAIKIDSLEILDLCASTAKRPDEIYALNLLKSELFIKRENPKDALVCLDAARYSEFGKNKTNSFSLEGFDIAINAMSGKNVDAAVEKFAKNSKSQIDICNLVKMLIAAKLSACADKVARAGLQKYPDSTLIYQQLTEIAEINNDTAEIVRLSGNPNVHIPIKTLAVLGKKLSSDRFVFIDFQEIEKAHNASESARKKIAAYKNIFGNF